MGLFFDASGLRQHGRSVTNIFNALIAGDLRQWPEAAQVPSDGDLYSAARQGMPSASDGDLWWMSWEGDPGLNAARPHPLGVAVEFRVMGWNAPRGLDDVMFVVATIYNVSASDPSVYQAYRPGLRDTLAALGSRFQLLNEAEFGVALPDGGYPVGPLHANIAVDPDITTGAGTNFASVNLPLAMGFAWHPDFPRQAGWAFPAEIFGPPFFAASGLVGVKYLRTPGPSPTIQLYSNFTGGGAFPDPNSAVRAFKYFAGAVTPADGISCNQGAPLDETHICFINTFSPSDIRFMESTPAMQLGPGESSVVAFAYVHAAPVAIAGYQRGTPVSPGDPTRMADAGRLVQGANTIDSIAGFAGYADRNGDGIVQPNELTAVRGSLVEKAQLAQAVFDNHFALPEAPLAPDFFLIPGSGEVTIVWRPSGSETTGDPFYSIAHPASVVPAGGGAPVPNPLYDANYRQFDVEGYRVWRGRTDNPAAMTLVAQYDYGGTVFSDYTGQVTDWHAWPQCAPELGVTESCPAAFDPPLPGVQLATHVDHDISGALLQVDRGDRTVLPDGSVLVLRADTLITGGGSGYPALANIGVPFAHVDQGLRNGLTYFYAVTSFDVNAISSTGAGHTSLESARLPRAVTPRSAAPTDRRTLAVEQGIYGRHGRLTDVEMPTIDPATGRFSKRFPPTDGITLDVIGVVPQLLAGSDEVSITFDSSTTTGFQPATSIEAVYHYTVHAPAGDARLRVPITQSSTTAGTGASGRFPALVGDPDRLARYGVESGAFVNEARYQLSFPSGYYGTVRARGCVNHANGFYYGPCDYNGPRWFPGDQETVDNPNASNPDRYNTGMGRVDFNNVGGGLGNVRTIFEPRAYDDYSNTWRDVEAVLLPFQSAADYRLFWGTNGVVDSVIDLTHDVVVPFGEQLGPSWGILNQVATQNGASYFDQRTTLTVTDAGCLEPIRSLDPGGVACSGPAAKLSRHAEPGPIAYGSTGTTLDDRTAAVAAGQGFVLYLKGHLFMVELVGPSLPAAGSAWTMRDYVGVVAGGNGRAGDGGAYQFTTQEQPRPFTAVGSSIRLRYAVADGTALASEADLARVHPVPDPYYDGTIDAGAAPEGITFINLPAQATVRIYSTSGVLLRVLPHDDPTGGGDQLWDLKSRAGRSVASGIYFYHVQAPSGATAVGRMTVVRH